MTAQIVFIAVGVLAIVGGTLFVVFRGRISARALRQTSGSARNPVTSSPTAMVVGGALLVAIGLCAIVAGLTTR